MKNRKLIYAKEAGYWDKFEKESKKYGTPVWVDYQKADTPEIDFINFSTDPYIDKLYLGIVKDRLIKEASVGTVLDLGCGSGWLALELARNGARVKAIDLSRERIRVARKYAETQNAKIDYKVQDVQECKWASTEKFDRITNWNTLHHIEDTNKVLAAVNDSLKLSGEFVSWDHLGDNSIVRFATRIAALIPNYYKQKKKVLGTIHSEAEGIASVRLDRKTLEKYFSVVEYKNYFVFAPIVPAVYKYLKYKVNIPIPRFLLIAVLSFSLFVDKIVVSLFPSMATYSYTVVKKKTRR